MNSEFQDKLHNLNVQPPAEVWSRIAASLDDKLSDRLSRQLLQFEQMPPETAWRNIAEQLDASLPVPGRGPSIRRIPVRRMGMIAAAAFLIMVAVTATLLINRKSAPQLPAQNANPQKVLQNDSSQPPKKTEQSKIVVTTNNLPKPDKEPMVASTSKSERKSKSPDEPDAPMVASYLPRSAARKDFAAPAFSADKYMIYSDDDGNAIRLPKKIFTAYVCPDESDACKQRLQQLREKFAESAVTADFTGLLEILRSLQENQ